VELFSLKEPKANKINFEGENSKHVLIICNTSITTKENIFLGKIFGSVKLDLSDMALMNSENSPTFHELRTGINFKKMVLFGTTPPEIGLNVNYAAYRPIYFQDIEILISESLVRLEGNEGSKTLLWNALKKMFL